MLNQQFYNVCTESGGHWMVSQVTRNTICCVQICQTTLMTDTEIHWKYDALFIRNTIVSYIPNSKTV